MTRLLCLIALALAMSAAGPAGAAERVALVMGNASYHGQPLRNPVNDARAMAGSLERLGFEVVTVIDGTQQAMQRAIGQFSRKLHGARTALVYYSGHGIQAQGINYMIPVDAELETEGDMPLQLVNVDAVMAQLIQAGTDVNILILDACRTNPFERKVRALAGAGLAAITAPKGTLIAYATAPGTTASDGEGQNSPYTTALLHAMAVPGQKVEEVFKQTRSQLARSTDNRQISWESSSLIGDFYFTGTAAPVPAPVPTAAAPPAPVAQTAPAPALPRPPQVPAPMPTQGPQVSPPPAAAPAPSPFASAPPPARPAAVSSIWGAASGIAAGTAAAGSAPAPSPFSGPKPGAFQRPPQGIARAEDGADAAGASKRPRGKFKIDVVNGTAWRMTKLYMSPSDKDDWQENVLDGMTLDPQEPLELTVNDGSTACVYDFRAVFRGGQSRENSNINICATKSHTIK